MTYIFVWVIFIGQDKSLRLVSPCGEVKPDTLILIERTFLSLSKGYPTNYICTSHSIGPKANTPVLIKVKMVEN